MLWLECLRETLSGSNRPAVIDQSGTVTGSQLMGKSVVAAERLAAVVAAPAKPVPALLSTNADALALLIGGAAANRPVAPVGPRLSESELTDVVRRCGSGVLLAEPQFETIARRVAAFAGARMAVVSSLPVSAYPLAIECGPVALYLHTSGTTGAPKPVPFTEDVLAARTALLSRLLGLGPDDRYASGSPLHHIGGLGIILVALSVGAAVLPTTAFSAEWWCCLRGLEVTHCLLVPTMIEMLLAQGLLAAVDLKTLIYGASPITPDTLARVIHELPQVALVNLFGQTEGSPITYLSSEDHRRAAAGDTELLKTVGRRVPGLRLHIDEPDESGTGEVLAAAEHLSMHQPDGWLHTGDLGAVDARGYLRLRGRRHDMVIRGGENVYPFEVESVLSAHPKIAAAGVVGVPDQRLGETLAAFVVPDEPGHPPDADELRSFTRGRLAGFKVPAYWYDVDALPLNSAGKLLRSALRDWHQRKLSALE
jgi:acyl-CoA synthetase (AMP-forming)/AMP-acid ligase II